MTKSTSEMEVLFVMIVFGKKIVESCRREKDMIFFSNLLLFSKRMEK